MYFLYTHYTIRILCIYTILYTYTMYICIYVYNISIYICQTLSNVGNTQLAIVPMITGVKKTLWSLWHSSRFTSDHWVNPLGKLVTVYSMVCVMWKLSVCLTRIQKNCLLMATFPYLLWLSARICHLIQIYFAYCLVMFGGSNLHRRCGEASHTMSTAIWMTWDQHTIWHNEAIVMFSMKTYPFRGVDKSGTCLPPSRFYDDARVFSDIPNSKKHYRAFSSNELSGFECVRADI